MAAGIDELVEMAKQAAHQADAVEGEASPHRWRQADAYAALARLGWSQRQIADACETNQTTVSYFVRCSERFPRESRRSFWEAYQEIRTDKPHVSHNSGKMEWYTPPGLLVAARDVLGEFDLDPASSDEAQRTVQAKTYFTIADDGLNQPWSGTVWLNPPYSTNLIDKFVVKLITHFEAGDVPAAVMLTNNGTETCWFQRAAATSSAICFPKERVKFLSTREVNRFRARLCFTSGTTLTPSLGDFRNSDSAGSTRGGDERWNMRGATWSK